MRLVGANETPRSQPLDPLPGKSNTLIGHDAASIGGTPAPLYYVSPNQINLQAPTSLSQGAANLILNVNGQTLTRAVRVVALRPGILVTAQNPAHAGEYLAVFCTGLGPTNPAVPAGQPNPLTPVSAVGSFLVLASYAGLAPGGGGSLPGQFPVAPGYDGDE